MIASSASTLPGSALAERDMHEQILVQTLEQAIDAVVVIDERNRVMLYNAAAETLWGWPRNEVLGRNVDMLVPHGIRAAHDGYVDANRASGVNRIVGTSREVPVERRDGTQLWASMSISRIVVGPRVLYTAFLKDVTAQRAQQQHLRQLSLVADRSGSAMAVTGADQRITYVNASFTRLLGYTSAQALGQLPSDLICGPHTKAQAIEALRTCAAAGQEMQAQALLYTRDGRPLWISIMMNPVLGAGGLEHLVFVLTDITHTKMHEVLQHKVLDAMAHGAPLRDTAALLCREVERIAPEVSATLLEVDAGDRLRVLAAPSLPEAIKDLTNGVAIGPEVGCCGTAVATGQPVLSSDLATDPRWAPVQQVFTGHGLRACWSNPIKARDGTVLGTLAFYYREPRGPDALHERLVDVGLHLCALLLQRERERAHIHQLAYYDALTGLANRSMLRAQAERMLHEARRNGTPLALLFIDLDQFKQVNDTQGHPMGDALLRAVAARLQDSARAGDVAARMGGDEFVLVLPQCGAGQAAAAAERLLAAIARPVEADGSVTLYPRASVGIAVYPEDGSDADGLLRCADLAMYRAKTAGSQRYRFYSAEMNAQTQERSRLENDLREALRAGGLALHYQPQMHGPALRGVEALLRWTHPQLGPIPPLQVVKTAEECGLLPELTHWVLQEACRQMADWRARGVAVPHVSVNFQAGSFLDPGLPALLAGTLAAHGLAPGDLTVEITETVMLTPDPAVLGIARAVRERGIALSLDDFGTGYSSLGALHRLPISEIKLDKSFVQDIETSATARALTCAVLHIARGLNLSVVAEGVETPAQHRFLIEHGCAVLQGYLLSRPLDAGALEAWLQHTAGRDRWVDAWCLPPSPLQPPP